MFDPNSAAVSDSGIFGLPFSPDEAAIVFLPVPWDATTSYRPGTAKGPDAILRASHQVDLEDADVHQPYEPGLAWAPFSPEILAWNAEARAAAEKVIAVGGEVGTDAALMACRDRVNALGGRLNEAVAAEAARWIQRGKIVAVVGGDHAVPFGAMQALARKQPFGVLHFDAHSDTRSAYEGFSWSHASIFHNVLERIPGVTRVVQVGIRDFCEQEKDYWRAQGDRVRVFLDRDLWRRKLSGEAWTHITERIVSALPREIWISFDIDGLDPKLCPSTGTPVPGGLELAEANAIIAAVVRSGRKILGFDLCEVAPDPSGASEWDANVGARLLYKLSAWTLASHGKCTLAAE